MSQRQTGHRSRTAESVAGTGPGPGPVPISDSGTGPGLPGPVPVWPGPVPARCDVRQVSSVSSSIVDLAQGAQWEHYLVNSKKTPPTL